MNARAQHRIERIMSDAFEQAAQVLEEEVRKMLRARPDRYSRFVLAVGWGPTLFDRDGKVVDQNTGTNDGKRPICARARKLLDFADEFYDRYGADNREVCAAASPQEQAPNAR
ncbi:hypothetical protein [Roseomonas chloroacetimidivorans]|uniref:hypothetical protein n=1 Tax=Roseomonas chloroacetimidivorans TaxID=1766656 RepID=UPI003C706CC1